MQKRPDESQGGEIVEPQSSTDADVTDKAIRGLVLMSAGLAAVSIVFGALGRGMGLPFAAGGVAAGLFAMRRMRQHAEHKHAKSIAVVIGVNVVLALIAVVVLLSDAWGQKGTVHLVYRMVCGTHMSGLGRCLAEYAAEHDGEYPPAEEWCDYLIKDPNAHEYLFVCKGAQKAGTEARCHYAMNPNARVDSAGHVVLLFETKGGWNLSGGRELLTFDNHEGEGCNILFVDGHAEFWKASNDPNNLNWGRP